MPDATQASAVRRFGAFEINLQAGELRKRGMRLRLSRQPFQVLAVLVEHAGNVVTREELHSKLWLSDTFVDFDHGLNNAVARIREVLDDSSDTPRYIETIPRRGYRFIAPLAEVPRVVVSPSVAESTVGPAHKTTITDDSGPAVLPAKGWFAATHRKETLAGAALLAIFAIIGLVLYRGTQAKGTKQPAIKSLAVLPLTNLSGDSAQEYFADGMTEAVIGRLSGIHDLRVISRTSVMRFKNTKLSVPEIAKTLGVDAIVEGSVIREGSRIRVHAQLIRAATDEHLWSEAYDRDLQDVLALQSDVAQSIAGKVEVTLTGNERARLVAARHVAPEVYESYLKGEEQLGKNTRDEIERSISYFEEALRKDPTFAQAYLGLANAYNSLSLIFVGGNPAELRPKIIAASRKALELDPELAEAHAYLGDIYQKEWHWGDAEAEYKRALELKPNDVTAHLGYANWLLCQGRMEEALAWSRRARELDPVGVRGVGTGWILFHARRYDEAIRELRSALAVHPDHAGARWFLGFALIGKGQPEEAIPELEKTVSLMQRSPGSIELLATAYAHVGRRTEALGLINELKQRRENGYVPAGVFINPYLGLGDYDEAFVWFERAYEEQSNILQFLKVHPFFDPVRGDPRFRDLLRRVGLE
jgi:TolB-like protein/DNA-binding winged helix-turn-helix (wHTH) protein/Tfp pilus assembly protein PilF